MTFTPKRSSASKNTKEPPKREKNKPCPYEGVGVAKSRAAIFACFYFSFVHCYNNFSKIALQLAQIYDYLDWNGTFEVTVI